MKNGFIEYSRKKFRFIPENKVYINKNTPVGEDADFIEEKPYNGKRYFYPIMEIKDNKILWLFNKRYNDDNKRWEYKISKELSLFLESLKIDVLEEVDFTTIIKE